MTCGASAVSNSPSAAPDTNSAVTPAVHVIQVCLLQQNSKPAKPTEKLSPEQAQDLLLHIFKKRAYWLSEHGLNRMYQGLEWGGGPEEGLEGP